MEEASATIAFDPPAAAVPPATGSTRINVGRGERIASVLAGTALAVYAVRNGRAGAGIAAAAGAVMLLRRGVTGYCEANAVLGRNSARGRASGRAMEARSTFTINKPREDVYAFWRQFERLPGFMKHLDSVTALGDGIFRWKARVPGGIGVVTWDARLITEDENRLLSWSSLPGSMIDNAGEVRFSDAPRNEGTEVRASISYRLPAGDVGGLAAGLFNPVIEGMIREDLRRFKSLIETGEIPTNERRPAVRHK